MEEFSQLSVGDNIVAYIKMTEHTPNNWVYKGRIIRKYRQDETHHTPAHDVIVIRPTLTHAPNGSHILERDMEAALPSTLFTVVKDDIQRGGRSRRRSRHHKRVRRATRRRQ
jgi:hypothetical protein